MDWIQRTEVLGNVGEFLGSIAILVTLIYLVIQVRIVRAQIQNDYMSSVHDVYKSDSLLRVTDPSINQMLVEADKIVDPERIIDIIDSEFFKTLRKGEMSERDILRLSSYWSLHWLSIGELIRITDDELIKVTILRSLATNLSSGNGALWWKSTRKSFLASGIHGHMAKEVEAMISKQDSA